MMLEFLQPYLLYLRIASYLVVAWVAWTVNDWRHDAAGRAADQAAADRRIEVTDQVRAEEHQDAKDADKIDKDANHANAQVAADAQPNVAAVADISGAADRVRSDRNAAGGNPVPGGTRRPGNSSGRSTDADRADRCEALLAEGLELGAEGGELLRGVAEDHDRAAVIAAAGHSWAVRKQRDRK